MPIEIAIHYISSLSETFFTAGRGVCHISSRLIVIYLTRSSTNVQVNRTTMRSVHNNTEISLCSIVERASRR